MSGRRQRTVDELKNAAPEFLLTPHEVHLLTGLAEGLVREAMASGELKSMPIGSGEEIRCPRWRVRQWQRDLTQANDKTIDRILRKAG